MYSVHRGFLRSITWLFSFPPKIAMVTVPITADPWPLLGNGLNPPDIVGCVHCKVVSERTWIVRFLDCSGMSSLLSLPPKMYILLPINSAVCLYRGLGWIPELTNTLHSISTKLKLHRSFIGRPAQPPKIATSLAPILQQECSALAFGLLCKFPNTTGLLF